MLGSWAKKVAHPTIVCGQGVSFQEVQASWGNVMFCGALDESYTIAYLPGTPKEGPGSYPGGEA